MWDFMSVTCPHELAAFDASFPDIRVNMERTHQPGISELHRHKRFRDEWVQLQAHSMVAQIRSGHLHSYCQARKAGEHSDEVHVKMLACQDLASKLKPSGGAFEKSKSGDLNRVFLTTLEAEAQIEERCARVMALPRDLTGDAFAQALEQIDSEIFGEGG